MEGLRIASSASDLIAAIDLESGKMLKASRGNRATLVKQALDRLVKRGAITPRDRTVLLAAFTELFDVIRGRRQVAKPLAATQLRLAAMLGDNDSTDTARALADTCRAILQKLADRRPSTDGAEAPGRPTRRGIARATTTIPTTGAERMAIGAVMGAVAGYDIGGPLGAVIGAVIGAAVGACADEVVVVTPEPGGGGGTGGPGGSPA